MDETGTYRIKIDQQPEERIEATGPEEASRKVAALLGARAALRRLADEEPVEIKRPDGRPWGRNLTIGAFRAGPVTADDDEGPVRPPSIQGE